MARGRMLSTEASVDPELHTISVQAMALYLLAIPHLDRDGLIDGRPMRLAALVAPMRPELADHAGSYINEWTQAGLVIRYEGAGSRPYLFFKGFRKHQQGMEYRREPASRIPPPPGWTRTTEGLIPVDPELCFRLSEHYHIKSAYRAALLAAAAGDVPGDIANTSRSHREVIANTSRLREHNNDDDDDHSYMPVPSISVSEKHACAREAADLAALLVKYTDDQLRIVADQLGLELGLSVQWDRWPRYLSECDRATLMRLIGHIQRWRMATADEFERVRNLPGLIRRAVDDEGSPVRLAGWQLAALGNDIDRALLVAVPEVER